MWKANSGTRRTDEHKNNFTNHFSTPPPLHLLVWHRVFPTQSRHPCGFSQEISTKAAAFCSTSTSHCECIPLALILNHGKRRWTWRAHGCAALCRCHRICVYFISSSVVFFSCFDFAGGTISHSGPTCTPRIRKFAYGISLILWIQSLVNRVSLTVPDSRSTYFFTIMCLCCTPLRFDSSSLLDIQTVILLLFIMRCWSAFDSIKELIESSTFFVWFTKFGQFRSFLHRVDFYARPLKTKRNKRDALTCLWL